MSEPKAQSLDEIYHDLWQRLATGVISARHPFHHPGLATITPTTTPDVRTVILRKISRKHRQLICHTDLRSDKVPAIETHPTTCWLFYDPNAKLQLRLTGSTAIHAHDELADPRWADSTDSSKRCYLAPLVPGTPTEAPSPNLPPDVRGIRPSPERNQHGRVNFAAVVTTITKIDWLYLAHDGHVRAQFLWNHDTHRFDSTWVAV